MASLTDYSPDVYLLTRNWGVDINASRGNSATLTYLETDQDIPGSTRVQLPKLGDSYSDDYPDMTLKNIHYGLLNGNPNCGKLYTCTYDSEPWMQTSAETNLDLLPKSIDISADYLKFYPNIGLASWTSDGEDVVDPLQILEAHMRIRVTRVIKNFDDYTILVFQTIKRINNATFLGIPAGMVRFEGATYNLFKSRSGADRWNVELTFDCVSRTGTFTAGTDGWQYQLRKDTGAWDTVNNMQGLTYQEADFTELFTGDLGDDEDLFNTDPTPSST